MAQMIQAGIAATEIVQRNADALGAQRIQHFHLPFIMQDEDRFRDLQHQFARRQLRGGQDVGHQLHQPVFIHLFDGQVHMNTPGRRPQRGLRTRAFQNPGAQRHDQPAALGQLNGDGRRHAAQRRVMPPQ
ncbi:hypothetical protein D3C73_1121520 [compost metagenome]